MVRYLNNQKYYDCQFITALNAASYFGEPVIKPGTLEYERWVDFLRCRDDGTVNVNSIFRFLRIGYNWIDISKKNIKRSLDCGRPIELILASSKNKELLHSALAVDYIGDDIKVPNNGFHRSHWVPWSLIDKSISIGRKIFKSNKYYVPEFNRNKFKSFYYKGSDVFFEMED